MTELGRAQAGLRVGVAVSGKLVMERTLPFDQDVTVGSSPGDTLIVPGVVGSTRVFSRTPKGLTLAPEVRANTRVRKGDAEATLARGDRGRVDLDGVTVLYQSITLAPRPVPVPVSTQGYRARWLDDDDPLFLQSLITWSALGLLLGIYVGTAPAPRNVGEDVLGDFLARLPPPVFIDIEEPPKLESLARVDVPTRPKREVEDKAVVEPTPKPRTEAKRATDIAKARETIESRMMKSGLIGSRGDSTWEIGVDEAVALDSTVAAPGWHGDEDGLRQIAGGIGAVDVELETLGGGGAEIGGGPNVFVSGAPTQLEQFATTEADGIRQALKRYSAQVRYCYERELKRDPKLGGRLEMGAILDSGRAVEVWTETQTVGNLALEQCIHERVRGWTFPPEASGEITWPYVFSAAD